MNAPVYDTAIGVSVTSDASHLSVVKQQGCAAAVWRRQMSPAVKTWLDQLEPGKLPSGRLVLRPDAAARAVRQLCEEAATPDCDERDWLASDIGTMSEMFAAIMSVGYLRLRLDAISTNACRKFHIDAVTARLVCTYRGRGTQYGLSNCDADPTQIYQVATGAPILLRGTLWPADPSFRLLHRSPPIEGTGETRLVLVLDPIFDPEEEF